MKGPKFFEADLPETPEAYWHAAHKMQSLGFHDDAASLREHARELERAKRAKTFGFVAFIIAMWFAIWWHTQ